MNIRTAKAILAGAALSVMPLAMQAQDEPAVLHLTDTCLMHEMRATPSPSDGWVERGRKISFQWPLATDCPYVDAHKASRKDKTLLRYKIRYSTDKDFKKNVVEAETAWPFYNPESDPAAGKWYWQHGYVVPDNGAVIWSPVFSFTVEDAAGKFLPPSYKELRGKIPATHPRVYVDGATLDAFRSRNAGSIDANVYLTEAEKILQTPMKTPADIKSGMAEKFDNEMKRNQMITRESRRVIDREEQSLDILTRAYILSQDTRFADEAIKRAGYMLEWTDDKNIAGDFNYATFFSVFTTVYDLLNDRLDADMKAKLEQAIRTSGASMYKNFNNRLENHIADNHVWQMTLRIFTMGAYTMLGHLPEAEEWAEYAYNVWFARFPGLNTDGAWHNGDSYFAVNFRTLIEVPFFYSRISGFDFFSDPWYRANVLYTHYAQPLGSHASGQGSAHVEKVKPHATRAGYMDALAKMTGDPIAADYTLGFVGKNPKAILRGSTGKSSGLSWFRLQCDRPLPEGGVFASLPMGYVFPESGLAIFNTNNERASRSARLVFRSSPYGSTSHALANQNSFNTFYAGKPIFYSSGHHTSFTDRHSLLCERSSRGHNTILVDGKGQRIGVEGYGWIPRYYVGEKIGYVLGDASNAYGPVTSPIWKDRAEKAEVPLTPENGWDEVGLKTFRRHIVELGKTGMSVIYDELEAEEPRTWSYLLHTIQHPMAVDRTNPAFVRVTGDVDVAKGDAFIFSSLELTCDTTSTFFAPAENWLKADANGNFAKNPDHWHFSATTPKSKVCRLLTVINSYPNPKEGKVAPVPQILKDGSVKMGRWIIKANLTTDGVPSFSVKNTTPEENVSVSYAGDATTVVEGNNEYELIDELPSLEI